MDILFRLGRASVADVLREMPTATTRPCAGCCACSRTRVHHHERAVCATSISRSATRRRPAARRCATWSTRSSADRVRARSPPCSTARDQADRDQRQRLLAMIRKAQRRGDSHGRRRHPGSTGRRRPARDALLAAALLACRALRGRPAALRSSCSRPLGAAVCCRCSGWWCRGCPCDLAGAGESPTVAVQALTPVAGQPVMAQMPDVPVAATPVVTPAGAAVPTIAPTSPVVAIDATSPVVAIEASGRPRRWWRRPPSGAGVRRPAVAPGLVDRHAARSVAGRRRADGGRLVTGRGRLRSLLRDASPVDDQGLHRVMRAATGRLAIRRPVSLRWSDALDVPVTFGVLRPVVILPGAAREWSPARRRAVLDHELAHVRRVDALTRWIGELAAVVYWFHPLVWKAIGEMRAERERACDDHVINCGTPASAYARDLLEIAAILPPQCSHPAALAMARRSQLEGRVVAVLDPDGRSPATVSRTATPWSRPPARPCCCLCVLDIGCAAARRPALPDGGRLAPGRPCGRARRAGRAGEPAEPCERPNRRTRRTRRTSRAGRAGRASRARRTGRASRAPRTARRRPGASASRECSLPRPSTASAPAPPAPPPAPAITATTRPATRAARLVGRLRRTGSHNPQSSP